MAMYSYDHWFILLYIFLWSNMYYIGDSLVHLHLKVPGSDFPGTQNCTLYLFTSDEL